MNTLECKVILDARLHELSSRRITREDIAIQSLAEEMDSIQQCGERALALESLTRDWDSSSLVRQALRRLESHTYGVCAECDEPISPKRIAALPWAKYCIRCQESVERSAGEVLRDTAT